MEQRHITRVMFSTVVHQSSTATATAIVREIKSRMTTRVIRRRGGQAMALLGETREGEATRDERTTI
jgi:hypothetical protein